VFVDGLALVVVFGMGLAIGAGQGLGRFVGFETEIAFLVFVGAGFVAEAGVAGVRTGTWHVQQDLIGADLSSRMLVDEPL